LRKTVAVAGADNDHVDVNVDDHDHRGVSGRELAGFRREKQLKGDRRRHGCAGGESIAANVGKTEVEDPWNRSSACAVGTRLTLLLTVEQAQ